MEFSEYLQLDRIAHWPRYFVPPCRYSQCRGFFVGISIYESWKVNTLTDDTLSLYSLSLWLRWIEKDITVADRFLTDYCDCCTLLLLLLQYFTHMAGFHLHWRQLDLSTSLIDHNWHCLPQIQEHCSWSSTTILPCPSNVILSNESCLRIWPNHLFCRLIWVSIIVYIMWKFIILQISANHGKLLEILVTCANFKKKSLILLGNFAGSIWHTCPKYHSRLVCNFWTMPCSVLSSTLVS